jgi:hypothetical protein
MAIGATSNIDVRGSASIIAYVDNVAVTYLYRISESITPSFSTLIQYPNTGSASEGDTFNVILKDITNDFIYRITSISYTPPAGGGIKFTVIFEQLAATV